MRTGKTPDGPPAPSVSRADRVASVLLPLSVILFGIVATIVLERGVAGFVDLCLTPFR